MPITIIERELSDASALTHLELDTVTTRFRRLGAAAAGLALVAGLATGCGSSSGEPRAAAAAATTEQRAQDYVGDPWERRSLVEHQQSPTYLGDPWEQRSLVEHQRTHRQPHGCQAEVDAGRR
jgi:hypothetical protein